MGYTKLFEELVASSVWDEDDKTRIVWITMLALKNRDHFVRGTTHYLALAARVTDEDCARALAKLSSADAESHNKEFDGRRVLLVSGGWQIVSGDKYQKMLSVEERREYQRVKQAEYRKRRKSSRHSAQTSGAKKAIEDGLEEAGMDGQEQGVDLQQDREGWRRDEL